MSKPTAAFFLLPTRSWEILLGANVAFFEYTNRRFEFNKMISKIGGGVGLFLLLYAMFAFNEKTPFPGAYALVPTMATALLIVFSSQYTLAGKVLGNRILVGVGLISYSAYLWHQPLLAFARYRSVGALSQFTLGLLVISTLGLAFLTWRYVERPFRDRAVFSRDSVFKYAGIGGVLFFLVALIIHLGNGFDQRMTVEQKKLLEFTSENFRDTLYRDVYRMNICFLDEKQNYHDFRDECQASPALKSDGGVLIWGDSHAAALSYGLRKNFKNVSQFNASGCPPVKDLFVDWRPHCKSINDYVLKK